MPFPTPADLNTLAARARVHAGLFSLPLRAQTWSGAAGDFKGSGVGSSLDFQDHRSYLPGDDPRHINWQAYARSGNYTLKLYREEVRPIVEILCDVSESMFSESLKARRVVELLYFAYASAEGAGASTSVTLLKGPRWARLEPSEILSHRWTRHLEELPPTTASAPPALRSIPLRARSLRVLISDLLFPSHPEMVLHPLAREAGRGILLAPYTRSEAEPSWAGNCELIDSESGEAHQRRIDSTLLRRYHQAYREHFSHWKTASLRSRLPLARISSDLSFEQALQAEAIPNGVLHLV